MAKNALPPEFLEAGKVVYAIVTRYRGRGPLRLLLHEGRQLADGSFAFGSGKCWTVAPGSLVERDDGQTNSLR